MEVGTRLFVGTLKKEYPNLGKEKENVCVNADSLLQKDYGDDYDCTLTCMASMFGEQNYNTIEKIAKKFGYNGKRNGTNPLCIKSIMINVMKTLGIKGKCKSLYGKELGYNFKAIQTIVKKGKPFILNLANDGRNYYTNHSVLIVGYMVYESGNRFIVIYDNWHKSKSYIDYDKLSVISSLNWYE